MSEQSQLSTNQPTEGLPVAMAPDPVEDEGRSRLPRNRHEATSFGLRYAMVGVAVILGVIVWMKPAPVAVSAAAASVSASAAGYGQVQPILAQRCYQCHGEQVQMKNVRLDSPAALKLHASQVYQQAVVTRLMPMNNATGITETERQVIRQWFDAGARTE